MSGSLLTHETTTTLRRTGATLLPPGRAARELGLKRGEFDLAVHIGRIRTVPDDSDAPGGGRRVTRDETERIRAVGRRCWARSRCRRPSGTPTSALV
ncbi:DUF6397 family protein [Streptomyces mutabilis]|uniref:DUF6397 family protein n=1 Tax=Streptomyces mutabilis TaxID=67332 RepID=UPI0036B89183